MTDSEHAAIGRDELTDALRRMRRAVLLRLGARMGYAISGAEIDTLLASTDALSPSFDVLRQRHRFDWIRNPTLLFRR